ncbi:hypothetical protein CYMTET_45221, partial [Cymbomonas tetramitiformis]
IIDHLQDEDGQKSPDSVRLIHPILNLAHSLYPKRTAPQEIQSAAFPGPKENSLFGTDDVETPVRRKARRRSSLTAIRADSLMDPLADGIIASDSKPPAHTVCEQHVAIPELNRPSYHRQVSRFQSIDADDGDDEDDEFTDHGSLTSSSSRKRSLTAGSINGSLALSSMSMSMSTSMCVPEGRIYPSVLQCERGHVVVLAVGDLLMQQLVSFIKPLRQQYLVTWKEIVIVSRTALSPQFLKFPGVHYIQREPMQFSSLEEACVQDASKVVILDGAPPTMESHQMDEHTILCNGVVESYLLRYPEKSVPKITVLHNRYNIKQLVGDAVAENADDEGAKQEDTTDSQEDGGPKADMADTVNSAIVLSKLGKKWLKKTRNSMVQLGSPRRSEEKGKKPMRRRRSTITGALMNQNKRVTRLSFPPDVHPHFVSGTSMALPDITRFVAHAYHTPGVLELIQHLIAPGIEDMPSMLWSLALDGDYQRYSTWGELSTDCIKQGCIPLALFRGANMGVSKPMPNLRTRRKERAHFPEEDKATACPFVVTNPPKHTIPTREDRALVLAPKRWAYANCITKEIVELFSAKRASRLVLTCFREWRIYGNLTTDEENEDADSTMLIVEEAGPSNVLEIKPMEEWRGLDKAKEAAQDEAPGKAPVTITVTTPGKASVNGPRAQSELTTKINDITQLAEGLTTLQRMELIQALARLD